MSENVIGKQITKLRRKFGYTQEDLAIKLGYSKQTISNWETGLKTPRMGAIQKLADLFNVSKSFIIESSESTSSISGLIIETIDLLEPSRQAKVYSFAEAQLKEQDNPKVKNLSEYKEEKQEHQIQLQSKVSAGRGVIDLDPSVTETITYYGKLPRHFDMAFIVDGNSMEPVFEDGDIIFVEKMEEVINGALMVVTVNDEAYIKKVYLDDDCIRLVSLNKEYKDIHATEGINIVGKVVF